MKLVTPPSWSGLPIYECEYRRGDAPVQIPVSLLVWWQAEGLSLEVGTASRRRSAYRAHAGRFDMFPAAACVAVTRADPVVHPLVVAVPPCWVRSLGLAQGRAWALEQPRLQFGDRPLERLVRGLHAHCLANEPLGRLYTQSLSTLIAWHLATLHARPEAATRCDGLPCIVRRKVEEFIDARLDAPPDVASLATLTGQGTMAFLRSFKTTVGITLHQYVMHRRIERAKQMLAAAGRPLTSVALELGFANHAHFTTAFRMRTGLTPSAWRRARLGRSTPVEGEPAAAPRHTTAVPLRSTFSK